MVADMVEDTVLEVEDMEGGLGMEGSGVMEEVVDMEVVVMEEEAMGVVADMDLV